MPEIEDTCTILFVELPSHQNASHCTLTIFAACQVQNHIPTPNLDGNVSRMLVACWLLTPLPLI